MSDPIRESDPPLNTAGPHEEPGLLRTVVAPLLVALIALTWLGWYAYSSFRSTLRQEVANEMQSIAKLKNWQIDQWLLQSREAIALIVTEQFALQLEQWMASGMPNNGQKQSLLRQLAFQNETQARDVAILTAEQGQPILASAHFTVSEKMQLKAVQVANRGGLLIDDVVAFPLLNNESAVRVGVFGLIYSSGPTRKVLAVIHILLSPSQYLFPMLSQWPGTGTSAEAMLARPENKDIVFLNTLKRDSAGTTGVVRRPINTPDLLGAKGLRDGEGFYEGRDYRGLASVGYVLPVQGTPWLLIVKRDRSEVYASLNRAAAIVVSLSLLMLTICALWLSRRREMEIDLRQAFWQTRDLYENAPCGYYSTDANGLLRRVNRRVLLLMGYDRDELIDRRPVEDLMTTPSRILYQQHSKQLLEQGFINDLELEFRRKDGSVFPGHLSMTVHKDKQGRFLETRSTIVDMTYRKHAETAQRRYGRALRLLSECNLRLAHAEDENTILNAVCELLVKTGGYRMAWVGIAMHDQERSVLPVSIAGYDRGYVAALNLSWAADTPSGRGPTGTAIREGKTQINQSFKTNPRMAPWTEAAFLRGYQSSVSLPLRGRQEVFGVLTMYSEEPEAFEPDEVELLEELAGNFAFGIESLRLREANQMAEESLQGQESLIRTVLDSLPIGVVITDAAGRVVKSNPASGQIWGQPFPPGSPWRIEHQRLNLKTGQWMDSDQTPLSNTWLFDGPISNAMFRLQLPDGGHKTVLSSIVPLQTAHGQPIGAISVVQDITELHAVEEELRGSRETLRQMAVHQSNAREEERKHLARELHDELGQLLTGVKMDLSWLASIVAESEPACQKVREMNQLIDHTLAAVRRISADLRPVMLDELGLKAALEWMTEEFETRHRHISCELVFDLQHYQPSPQVSITVYRIIQEGLTNVARHSGATTVDIFVTWQAQDALMISVSDNGRGLPVSAKTQQGFGLMGMKERVHSLGGVFKISSESGQGLALEVCLPLHLNTERMEPDA